MPVPPKPAHMNSSSYSRTHTRLARMPYDRSAYAMPTVLRGSLGYSYANPSSSRNISYAPLPPAPRPRLVPLPDVGDDTFHVTPARFEPSTPPLLSPTPLPPRRQLPTFVSHPESDTPPLSRWALFAPPSISTLLAVPQNPGGTPLFKWDLADNPLVALLGPENAVFAQCTDLRRCAVRTHVPIPARATAEPRKPLRALTLILPQLPGLQIRIRHLSTAVPLLQPNGDRPVMTQPVEAAGHLTLWDVLEGLHQGLRVPLSTDEITSFDDEQLAAVLQAAEARRARGLDNLRGPAATRTSSAGIPGGAAFCLRRVDVLGGARRFVGIRPALRHEMPKGQGLRSRDAVFVVEVAGVGGYGVP